MATVTGSQKLVCEAYREGMCHEKSTKSRKYEKYIFRFLLVSDTQESDGCLGLSLAAKKSKLLGMPGVRPGTSLERNFLSEGYCSSGDSIYAVQDKKAKIGHADPGHQKG